MPLVNGCVSDALLNAAVQVVSRHCRKISCSDVKRVTLASLGCKLKQNANEGCNSCASLVCFITAACCSCKSFKLQVLSYR